jgi:hypothetical protein
MVQVMVILATAYTVLLVTGSVIYLMQQMVSGKQSECTENTGAVHLWHALLQILQGKSLMGAAALLPHQNPHGGRFDVMLL